MEKTMERSMRQTTGSCPPRPLAGARVICLLGVLLSAWAGSSSSGAVTDEGSRPAQPRETQEATAASPVILLTGFEPFGARKSPNPSWEGIKGLDGRQWKGHRLVCKQMEVVWGAPLRQVQEWVSAHRPVAVFSFGQGGGGSFALESRASNQRGRIPDNRQQLPPAPTVIDGGPAEFRANIDCERLARVLAKKGYPIRVSNNAGRYLCEEALYALEYLRAKRAAKMTVLFCHVPPLGSQLQGRTVDAQYVQRFVEDTLEAWSTMDRAATPSRVAEGAGNRRGADPRHREVKELIERYFQTWSAQDMGGYGKCFASNACVQFIDPQGRLTSLSKEPFLATQREAHANARHRQTEVPESIDIRFEVKLARVVVYWKLTAGPETKYGYDHFTLMKHRGEWRIVNLVFYVVAGPG